MKESIDARGTIHVLPTFRAGILPALSRALILFRLIREYSHASGKVR